MGNHVPSGWGPASPQTTRCEGASPSEDGEASVGDVSGRPPSDGPASGALPSAGSPSRDNPTSTAASAGAPSAVRGASPVEASLAKQPVCSEDGTQELVLGQQTKSGAHGHGRSLSDTRPMHPPVDPSPRTSSHPADRGENVTFEPMAAWLRTTPPERTNGAAYSASGGRKVDRRVPAPPTLLRARPFVHRSVAVRILEDATGRRARRDASDRASRSRA